MPQSLLARVGLAGDHTSDVISLLDELGIERTALSMSDLTQPSAFNNLDALILLPETESSGAKKRINNPILESMVRFVEAGGSIFAEGDAIIAEAHNVNVGQTVHLFGLRPANTLLCIHVERVFVVTGHYVTQDLDQGELLQPQRSMAVIGAVEGGTELLRLGKALGTYHVSYALPEVAVPALVSNTSGAGRTLYASFPLSRFQSLRFVPAARWHTLIARALLYLLPDRLRLSYETIFPLPLAWIEPRRWVIPDRPCNLVVDCAANTKSNVSMQSLDSSTTLLSTHIDGKKTRLPSEKVGEHVLKVQFQTSIAVIEQIFPLTIADRRSFYLRALERNLNWFMNSGIMPDLSGAKGVWEAVQGESGELRYLKRPDCNWQTALIFFLAGQILGKPVHCERGLHMAEYLLKGGYQSQEPGSPTYGLFNWAGPSDGRHMDIFVDDNSWAAICAMLLGRYSGQGSIAQAGFLAAQALRDTQGIDGLNEAFIGGEELVDRGREYFSSRSASDPNYSGSPHFTGMAAAMYFIAYGETQDPAYLAAGRRAMEALLSHYPGFEDVFRISRTQAYARWLFPLAMACGHDPDPRWKILLAEADDYLAARLDKCGALQEWDAPHTDAFQGDVAIFHKNGEPIADLLYTVNFALLNYYLAFCATHDRRYLTRFEQIGDFVARIQVESTDPALDGGWMRAFDYQHWEYYGSTQDTSWGPYVMESGWTNAPISLAFALFLLEHPVLATTTRK